MVATCGVENGRSREAHRRNALREKLTPKPSDTQKSSPVLLTDAKKS